MHFDHDDIMTDHSEDSDEERVKRKKKKVIHKPAPKQEKPKLKALDVEKYLAQNCCNSEEEGDQSKFDEIKNNNKEVEKREEMHEDVIEDTNKLDHQNEHHNIYLPKEERKSIDTLFNIEYIKQKVHKIVFDEIKIMIPEIVSLIKIKQDQDKIEQANREKEIKLRVDQNNKLKHEPQTNEENKYPDEVNKKSKDCDAKDMSIENKLEKECIEETKNKIYEPSCTSYQIMCNECKCSPLKGTRYMCIICENYDICENCESRAGHQHPLLKIKNENKFKKLLGYFSNECNQNLLNQNKPPV